MPVTGRDWVRDVVLSKGVGWGSGTDSNQSGDHEPAYSLGGAGRSSAGVDQDPASHGATCCAGNENVSKINKHAMKAISGYDNIRQSVMAGHDQAKAHINQTVSNLKKAGVSIGL